MGDIMCRKWVRKLSASLSPGAKMFVAGGCAVDLFLKRVPKDIDVFLIGFNMECFIQSDPYREGVEYYMDSTTFLGHTVKLKGEKYLLGTPPYSERGRCIQEQDVVYTARVGGEDVDLVFLNHPRWKYIETAEHLTKTFDMSICQGWIKDLNTLDWQAELSDCAKGSIETQVIQYYGDHRSLSDTRLAKPKRIARYKAKFPEFKIYERL